MFLQFGRRSAASSPENLLEMQIIGPTPDPINEKIGGGGEQSVFSKAPGGSDATQVWERLLWIVFCPTLKGGFKTQAHPEVTNSSLWPSYLSVPAPSYPFPASSSQDDKWRSGQGAVNAKRENPPSQTCRVGRSRWCWDFPDAGFLIIFLTTAAPIWGGGTFNNKVLVLMP